MLTPFHVAAVLVVLTAVFAAVNHHVLRLPSSIGLLVVALAASLAAMAADALVPGLGISDSVRSLVESIDFDHTLMDSMLGFLLFAGALHVNLGDLREQRWVVAIMASLGVLLSTVLVGLGFASLAGVPVLVALVFGALISPTDPVAVLGILKVVKVPKSLEVKIAGESLFNDGVAVVVFAVLVAVAFPAGGGEAGAGAGAMTAGGVVLLFLQEAVGGVALGGFLGWLTYLVLKRTDDYVVEVLLTLALVMGGYALAHAIHVSGPLVLAVRFLAVLLPVWVLKFRRRFTAGAVAVMTWGGLRGGISVALALSLLDSEWKATILIATYVVVIFSVVVQGLTVGPLIRRVVK